MANLAAQSDDTINAARNALQTQRYVKSIGMRSRALKRGHVFAKLGRVALAVCALLVGMGIFGAILDGIGFWGIMISGVIGAAAVALLLKYPSMPRPTADSLRVTDLSTLAGKTEIWLEGQRAALPPPAVTLIENIGVRLDQLAPQLQRLGENDPAAGEVRKLVGEHLPELINGYRSIPDSLRNKQYAGKTPQQQLVDGLTLIDREIDTMTGQIARGELDKLAVRGRYLEMKYAPDSES
jgi:hypothetical protein